jgi:predicted RNA-binding Zn ribbon-like protein
MGQFSDIGGALALDFVNTRPMREGGPFERLATFDDVLRWCVQFHVLSPASARRLGGAKGERTIRTVHKLREALRAALEAQVKGRPRWRPLIVEINAALARSPRIGAVTMGAAELTFSFEPIAPQLDDIPALLAERIAEFVLSPDAHRARACAADDCVLWFLDSTRNRSRHWCRMETCGARAKARAYYRRKKG